MGKSDSVPRNQGSISSTHSFYARRSRKRKKLLDLTDFFALLLSACIEAEHKHVDEIDPKCDCILKRNMNMNHSGNLFIECKQLESQICYSAANFLFSKSEVLETRFFTFFARDKKILSSELKSKVLPCCIPTREKTKD